MEAKVGVISPLLQSSSQQKPSRKRMRASHSNPGRSSAAKVVSQPRGSLISQDGVPRSIEADRFSSGSVNHPKARAGRSLPVQAPSSKSVHNVRLQTPNPQSSHPDITAGQHYDSGPTVGQSSSPSNASPISCVLSNDEVSLPPQNSGWVNPATTSQSFAPAFNYSPWMNTGPSQSGYINGEDHSQNAVQSQPEQIPLSSHQYPTFNHQIHGLSEEQGHLNTANVSAIGSVQSSHGLPSSLLPSSTQQLTAFGGDNHQFQPPQPSYQTQGFRGALPSPQNASVNSLQIVPPLLSQQFGQPGGPQYSQYNPHTSFNTNPYFPSPIGVGHHIPDYQQGLNTGSFSQPPIHPPNTLCAVPGYPGDMNQGVGTTIVPDAPDPSCTQSSGGNWPRPISNNDPGVNEGDVSGDASGQASGVSGDVKENAIMTSENTDTGETSSGQMPTQKNTSKEPRSRGRPNADRRKQTTQMKKTKACMRCRTQKMRCDVDYKDPDGACMGCKGFSKTSKKTIHLSPCFRGKLTDVVLYRTGGLQLTNRWQGTEMMDIADRIEPTDIRVFEFTLGLCDVPVRVDAVAFQPKKGDVTARFWTVQEGGQDVRRKKDLAQYCLVDIHRTASEFEKYVITNAISAMLRQRIGPVQLQGQHFPGPGVIERTYAAALRYYSELKGNNTEDDSSAVSEQCALLRNLFILWFSTRHTTGSSWIVSQETLGMKPEMNDQTYPLFGKVSVPRMILAQYDSITHTKLLSKYGKEVLRQIENLISRNQPSMWFTIYLCLFILLREASWMCEDRYRHARNNYGSRIRYSIPSFVEELQEGCNNLLQHWHYYNCRPWPDPASPWERHKSLLAELGPEQYDLVMETMTDPAVQKQLNIWRRYKGENGYLEPPSTTEHSNAHNAYSGSQAQYDWDHPFYWVSQLFEEQWIPHRTYQREYIG